MSQSVNIRLILFFLMLGCGGWFLHYLTVFRLKTRLENCTKFEGRMMAKLIFQEAEKVFFYEPSEVQGADSFRTNNGIVWKEKWVIDEWDLLLISEFNKEMEKLSGIKLEDSSSTAEEN